MINNFSKDSKLAELLPNYMPRPSQIEMAKSIEKTLSKKSGRLIVEAGTGTGKSLAYLIAALKSDKKIIISTATKTLQDQLYQKDLPLALKALNLDKSDKFTLLMKGRANYLCLLKAENFSATSDLFNKKQNKLAREINKFIKITKTGDRAEIKSLSDDSPVWHELSAASDSCIGSECKFFSDCYVTRLRRKAQAADVLVINHALLCIDQKNDGDFGRLLPDPEVLIIDEAHALEDVATRSFGVEITGKQLRYLSRDLQSALPEISKLSQTQFSLATQELLPSFLKIWETFGTPEAQKTLKNLTPHLNTLQISLSSAKLDLLSKRLFKLITELNFILSKEAENTGYVIFADKDNRGSVLRAAPIEPAEILKKTLWEQEASIILTSATLAISKSLKNFRNRVGLEDAEDCEERVYASPFDTFNQAELYIPKSFISLESEMLELVTNSKGGAFLLFTSYRQLNLSYDILRSKFESQGLEVFKQGDMPKLDLIKSFIKSDQNFGGVLFATQSFWEGVDVPGKALRLVIIDKLPFKSPGDPIQKARCEKIESQGKSSFFELSVPQAALALKQGVGRLLRSHEDTGLVAILDTRLLTKNYGRIFLDSLPPMKRVYKGTSQENNYVGA